MIKSLVLSLMLLASHAAFAQQSGEITATSGAYDNQFRLAAPVQLYFLGGLDALSRIGAHRGFSGDISIALGRDRLGIETGVMGLNRPTLFTQPATTDVPKPTGSTLSFLQYVGVPLLLKYNYIEKPQNVFSLKAGGVYGHLLTGDRDLFKSANPDGNLSLNADVAFAEAGFTGTSKLTNSMSFVLDAAYLFAVTPIDNKGTKFGAALIQAGLMVCL